MSPLKSTLEQLLARVAQLEERTARAEDRAVSAEEPSPRPAAVQNGNAAVTSNGHSISRRQALVKAAVAGAAGLGAGVLLKPRDVAAAYNLQGDTGNFGVAGTYIQPASSATWAGQYVFWGFAGNLNNATTPSASPTVYGMEGTGSGAGAGLIGYGGNYIGPGVYGSGGGTSGPGGFFVGGGPNGFGTTTYGTGGGTGLYAVGGGSGAYGAEIYGGGSNSTGVLAFSGLNSGYGVYAVGETNATGTTYGIGVVGFGGGLGSGGYLQGGANNGQGLRAYGGGASGVGVLAAGLGTTGDGVTGFGGSQGLGGYFAGGRAQVQLAPEGSIGAPTTNFHGQGDLWLDNVGVLWVCTVGGTPGTFLPVHMGGAGQALFTAVSTQQYTLTGSDGSTWVDMDATKLSLTITPPYNSQATLTANSDLWTSTGGHNQDIAIFISGGAYGAGKIVGWKESNGANTFSPNAAFLEVAATLVGGTTYTVKIQWKANTPSAAVTIWAGAGPINGLFSPTRLAVTLIPDMSGVTVLAPAKPYQIPVTAPMLPAPVIRPIEPAPAEPRSSSPTN